jgi:hypothetical protein
VRQTAVDAAKAQEEVLAHTDRPRLYLQSSVFARGSGANPNGELDGGLNGLGLERANWAAGRAAGVSQSLRCVEPARAQGRRGGERSARKRRATTRRS